MRIGIASSYRYKSGSDWDEALQWIAWVAKHGEANGYSNVWMTEHHFSEEVGAGTPVMLLNWLAAQTTTIRLGTAVALLPFHHPIRLAEEFLLLDRVSGGRADIGVGRGHAPIESSVFCADPGRSREMFDDAFAILQCAFRGDAFEFRGDYYRFPRVKLFPPPVQSSRPGADRPVPFYMPITSPRSVDFAARNGIIPLVGYSHEDQVRQALDQYRTVAAEVGMPEQHLAWILARGPTTRSVCVGDTRAHAEDMALSELAWPHFSHSMYGLPPGDPGFHSEMPEDLPPLTPDQLMAGTAIYGTADEVAEQLLELDRIGVHHVSVAFGFRCSIATSQDRAERFTRGVMPRVLS